MYTFYFSKTVRFIKQKKIFYCYFLIFELLFNDLIISTKDQFSDVSLNQGIE